MHARQTGEETGRRQHWPRLWFLRERCDEFHRELVPQVVTSALDTQLRVSLGETSSGRHRYYWPLLEKGKMILNSKISEMRIWYRYRNTHTAYNMEEYNMFGKKFLFKLDLYMSIDI